MVATISNGWIIECLMSVANFSLSFLHLALTDTDYNKLILIQQQCPHSTGLFSDLDWLSIVEKMKLSYCVLVSNERNEIHQLQRAIRR